MKNGFLCRMQKFMFLLFICSFILTTISYFELSKTDYTYIQLNKMDFKLKRNFK